eukprot:725632-Ditylum_brightwellii.AAC.1
MDAWQRIKEEERAVDWSSHRGHFATIYDHNEHCYMSRWHQDDAGMVSKAHFASPVGREGKRNDPA